MHTKSGKVIPSLSSANWKGKKTLELHATELKIVSFKWTNPFKLNPCNRQNVGILHSKPQFWQIQSSYSSIIAPLNKKLA